jgi:uncharacterized damage-inducible protein DinB
MESISMQIRDILLPEFEAEAKNTRRLLELVPETEFGYQPHTKSMSLGRLASHISELPQWVAGTLNEDGLDLQPGAQPYIAKSRAALLDTFDNAVAEAQKSLAGADDARMLGTWTFSFAGKPQFSNPRYIILRNFVFSHLVHHRAQLGVYLRLKDVEFPGMYGPSADEMKFWSAQSA